jgi:hypothetical protein
MLLESLESLGIRAVRLSKYLENYSNKVRSYPGGMAIIRNNKFSQSIDQTKLTELAQSAIDIFGYSYDKNEIAKIAARIFTLKFHLLKSR